MKEKKARGSNRKEDCRQRQELTVTRSHDAPRKCMSMKYRNATNSNAMINKLRVICMREIIQLCRSM